MQHSADSHRHLDALDDAHGHDDGIPFPHDVAVQCYSILRPFLNPTLLIGYA